MVEDLHLDCWNNFFREWNNILITTSPVRIQEEVFKLIAKGDRFRVLVDITDEFRRDDG